MSQKRPESKSSAIEKTDPKIHFIDDDQEIQIIKKVVRQEILARSYSGPIPPAEEFEKYEKALPGAGDRILKLAEKEQENRHLMISRGFKAELTTTVLGQVFAFILGMSGILCGLYLVSEGKQLAGFSAFITALAAIVAAFIYTPKNEKPKAENDNEGTKEIANSSKKSDSD